MRPEDHCVFPPFRLDPANEQLWRGTDEIRLRGKTFAVLRFLVDHPGQLVTKAALLDAVWPETSVSDTMPTICVGELRKVLGDEAKMPQFIETVHGRGYRFIAKVTIAVPQMTIQRPSPGPTPIMVGREEELAQMREWFAQASEGTRQVVFIAGEAGSGKTTFVRAFLDSLAQDGALRIGRGQCIEQYGSGEPYMPVLEALTRLGQEPEGERLREILRRVAPTWLVQMPSLVTTEDRARMQGETLGATRQRMLREMTEAIEAMAADAPFVLVLEDLHWSDFSTLELIATIARRTEPARILIVGAYRPVEMLVSDGPLRTMKEELELHQNGVELRLKLLSEAHVADYLGLRFADGAAVHSFSGLAPVIHQRTEGNPLFMVNVVDYLAAQGPLIDASKIEAPRSIRQMIERNLDRLSAHEQAVLQSASIAGAEFSAAAVAAAAERPVNEIEECCSRLSRREQFVGADGVSSWPDGTVAASFRFRHALYRDVLYERTPPGQRVESHRRVAEREEAAWGEGAAEIAGELAFHYHRCGNKPKAIQFWQLAGDRSSTRGALVEAESHYIRALESLGGLPENAERDRRELGLQVGLGLALWGAKGWAHTDTYRAFTRAQALGEKLGETHQLIAVLNGLWNSAFSRAQMRASQELAERMMSLAKFSGDRGLLCVANYSLATTLLWRAQLAKAQEHLDLSSSYFDETDSRPLTQLSGHSTVIIAANVALHQGFPDRARRLLSAALQTAARLGNLYNLAFARMSACLLYIRLRDRQIFLAHADELRRLAEEIPFFQGHVEYFADVALAMLGRLADGLARTRRANAFWEAIEFRLSRTYVLQTEAEFYASEGRVDEALAKVKEAAYEAEEVALRRPEILTLRGDLFIQSGASASEIEAAYREALECARAQDNRWDQLKSTAHFARWLKSEGRMAEARTMLAEIYNWFTEGFDTADLKDAKALLDELVKKPQISRISRSAAARR